MDLPKTPEPSSALERALKRERLARKHAEQLLETRARELYQSKVALEEAFSSTVAVFASLIGDKSGRTPASLRRLGRDAKRLAKRMGLNDSEAQDVYLASLLCDLGKLAISDDLVNKPLVALSVNECNEFGKHPRLAYEALTTLKPLENVAQIILEHCELFDGKGYPERLTWDDISLSAQILCVVKNFDALKRGLLVSASLTETEALKYLESQRDKSYGKEVVDSFVEMVREQESRRFELHEMRHAATSLKPGMVLTRDLVNEQDVLILPADQVLNEDLIDKLIAMSKTRSGDLIIYVAHYEEV